MVSAEPNRRLVVQADLSFHLEASCVCVGDLGEACDGLVPFTEGWHKESDGCASRTRKVFGYDATHVYAMLHGCYRLITYYHEVYYYEV